MIGLARHNDAEKNGVEAPDATRRAGEIEPEQPPGSPLEWYLMKLLEPTEGAPHEPVPPPADERRSDETSAPPQLDATGPPGQQEATEAPKESKPLWQVAEEEPPKVRGNAGAARVAKSKSVIRSHTRKARAGGNRQRLMMTLIPVLAIAMVVLLKHPLGARPTATAAAPLKETAHPVVAGVEIAWELPALYELDDRDPMRLTPPAVTVENAETSARPTEPAVDLIVTGILYSEDKPMAIVDTEIVHEGQKISGATVEKIDRDGIQFERNGRRWKQAVNQ